MKTSRIDVLETHVLATRTHKPGAQVWQPQFLQLLTPGELLDLKQTVERRAIPLDFEAKLNRLAKGNLVQRFVSKHCADFIALLFAARDGGFSKATAAD